MASKKMIPAVLSGVVALSLLAGCATKSNNAPSTGGSAAETPKKDDSAAQAKPVTLDFWAAWSPNSDEETKTKEQIKKFEDSHPNIKINVQLITFDVMHDKLIAAINAGNAPDLSWGLSEWFGEFTKMDALQDLTASFNAWSDKDKIYPNVMASLTTDGKIEALPQYLGIRALLYHEDMLKKAGYDAPPKTWDDLLAMADKVKQATGKEAFGIAASGVRSPQELLSLLAQNDLEIAKKMDDGKFKNTWKDNPDELKRAAEVYQFYKDLLAKGAIKPEAKTWGWQEEDTNFAQGQYAMVVNGSWIEGRTKENPEEMKDVKVAAPPSKKKAATFLEVSPLYLYKSSQHPKEAFEFATYILGKEWQTNIRPTSSPRSDVVSDSQWGKGFTDLASTGVVFPSVSLGGITKDMEDSIARDLIKNDSPEDVAKWLSDAINNDLKKTGELSSK
jgi:ABC-type glycerol-3-phosphate transport system substrate-binding protein